MYALPISLLAGLTSTVRTRTSLQVEIFALRHQLTVIQRTQRRRVPLRARDLLLWVALYRLWPDWRKALVLVKPETVIAWCSAVMRSISLKRLDFDCNRTPRVVDLETEQAGSVTPLMADYTSAINLASINKAFDFFKKWPLPIEIKTEDMVNLSEYPNSFECTQKR